MSFLVKMGFQGPLLIEIWTQTTLSYYSELLGSIADIKGAPNNIFLNERFLPEGYLRN